MCRTWMDPPTIAFARQTWESGASPLLWPRARVVLRTTAAVTGIVTVSMMIPPRPTLAPLLAATCKTSGDADGVPGWGTQESRSQCPYRHHSTTVRYVYSGSGKENCARAHDAHRHTHTHTHTCAPKLYIHHTPHTAPYDLLQVSYRRWHSCATVTWRIATTIAVLKAMKMKRPTRHLQSTLQMGPQLGLQYVWARQRVAL